jgi:hypothetical protein
MLPIKCECVKCQRRDLQIMAHFFYLALSSACLPHLLPSMARKETTKPLPQEEDEPAEVPNKCSTRSTKKKTAPPDETGECS